MEKNETYVWVTNEYKKISRTIIYYFDLFMKSLFKKKIIDFGANNFSTFLIICPFGLIIFF